MRAANDKKTADILGDSCDLAGPVPPAPTAADKARARAARYRERHGVQALTVNIPADVLAAFNEAAAKRGMSKNALIEKLIRTQLLRKR